ncbi:hypothetical protein TWF225_012027 [Orbilia oligospora]|nr:hypothetical protein TWF225_012027 [Orbilia oligospora]KAF3240001.1 hypothetical protein TWF217_001129 [Orbilia oligospora]KAF3277193.1 hypothetical protein TWF132_001717 [Orbilia oligospora]
MVGNDRGGSQEAQVGSEASSLGLATDNVTKENMPDGDDNGTERGRKRRGGRGGGGDGGKSGSGSGSGRGNRGDGSDGGGGGGGVGASAARDGDGDGDGDDDDDGGDVWCCWSCLGAGSCWRDNIPVLGVYVLPIHDES